MTGAPDLAYGWKRLPVLGILLTCAGYYLGGIVGITLIFPSSAIAILWPSNAILLAALLLSPVRTWWIYALAVFPTHLHLVYSFQPGVPLLTMLSQAFSNIVQAVAGAGAVGYVIGPAPRLDNLRSTTAFILLAAIAAPGLAAAVAAYLFILTGWAADFWSTWRIRFLANPFAVLSITPLILQADADWFRAIRGAPLRRHAEFGLLLIGLLLVTIAVFGQERRDPALLYAPLPLLLWAAVRFGLSGLCASLLLVALLSLSNATAGRGPFVTQSPVENSRSLQIFLITVSVPLMLLSVLLDERRRIADALRASLHDVQHLAGQLISAQEAERARIARDLHDDIGQRVASFCIGLSRAKRQIPDVSSPAGETLSDLQQRATRLATDLRHLSHHLHPSALEFLGLVQALRERCHEFSEESGVGVRFDVSDTWRDVSGAVGLCLYRVAQEALRNVAAHAQARQVTVSLDRRSGHLLLEVTDDGRGFDPTVTSRRSGLGLVSLRERVRMLGGVLEVTAAPDSGTRIVVTLPSGETHSYAITSAPR